MRRKKCGKKPTRVYRVYYSSSHGPSPTYTRAVGYYWCQVTAESYPQARQRFYKRYPRIRCHESPGGWNARQTYYERNEVRRVTCLPIGRFHLYCD